MVFGIRWILSGMLAIWAVSAPLAASGKTTKDKASPTVAGVEAKPIVKDSSKQGLGDAFIAQNTLRVYLERPVSISVFNVRGQLVFRQDSERALEIIPLSGMPTGFLYLTLRSGNNELTKKLVYTGK
jgi:hypothetical protein